MINLNYSRKSLEWGYGIDPKLWGKGYILMIQECLKKYVFETFLTLSIASLEIDCDGICLDVHIRGTLSDNAFV